MPWEKPHVSDDGFPAPVPRTPAAGGEGALAAAGPRGRASAASAARAQNGRGGLFTGLPETHGVDQLGYSH